MFVTNWHQWLRQRSVKAAASTHNTRKRKSCRLAQRAHRPFQPLLEALEDRLALAASLTVNSVLDSDTRDGVLTLREAIMVNNRTLAIGTLSAAEQAQVSGTPTAGDTDTIAFSIGGGGVQTIAPTSALPTITDPVTIDGYTQPGASPNTLTAGSDAVLLIELNGASAGLASGLVITAGNSTVRGLVINRFQAVGVSGTDGKGAGIVLSTNGGNVIEGNYIGTDVSGTAGRGNFRWGVLIFAGSSANRVGTNGDGIIDPAERNVISSNGTIGNNSTGAGLIIIGTHDNVVAGNYMGTDATGTVALGNTNRGISVQSGAHDNRIGTDGNGVADTAERNLLSGNRRNGIVVASDPGQPLTYGNTVAGNYIGTDAAGTGPLGNGRFGVNIFGAAQGNQVGGSAAALSNTIAFNGEAGVIVLDVATDPVFATGNRIQGNSIHSNTGLGIDLALDPNGANGVTPNDLDDGDPGPNNLQNFPVINAAHSGPQTFVSGTLNSLPDTAFTLDFYASPAADPSGYGEGARYLGSWPVSTPIGGNDVSFDVLLDVATTDGEFITATATEEPTGSTSEFSLAVQVTNLVIDETNPDTVGNSSYLFTAHGSGGVEVFLNGNSQGVASQIVVFDPDGADTYTVDFGGWTGNVTLFDIGGFGTDILNLNGTIAADQFNKQFTFVDWNLDATPTETSRVNYTGIETANVFGGDGNDTILDPAENTNLFGGPGDDTIIIDATFGNGVVVDGGDGSDNYVVMFGNLAGPVTVADSGATGVDSLEVQGTAGDDALALAGNEVQNGAERVIIAAPVESLDVDAGDGADSITVGDFTAPITSLGLDGGTGANDVTIEGSLPPGVELDVVGATQTVDVNIRRHAVNLNSHGKIAVVLYTTATFNASQVDVGTVVFAGAHVAKHRLRDVDCDGDLDLVLKFRTQETNLRDVYTQLLAEADQTINGKLDKRVSTTQEAMLSLTGETVDGLFFEGFDTLDLFLSGKELKHLLHDLAAAGKI